MAKIHEIDLGFKDNTLIFDDTDSREDYFHAYNKNQKLTIAWVKEHGAPVIGVDVTNNDPSIPAERRIKQICKAAGYRAIPKHRMEQSMYSPVPRKVFHWRLEKI
jgi:hypothetical protein